MVVLRKCSSAKLGTVPAATLLLCIVPLLISPVAVSSFCAPTTTAGTLAHSTRREAAAQQQHRQTHAAALRAADTSTAATAAAAATTTTEATPLDQNHPDGSLTVDGKVDVEAATQSAVVSPVVGSSSSSERFESFAKFLLETQDAICRRAEASDGKATFCSDRWERDHPTEVRMYHACHVRWDWVPPLELRRILNCPILVLVLVLVFNCKQNSGHPTDYLQGTH